jgi:hypothetical protein
MPLRAELIWFSEYMRNARAILYIPHSLDSKEVGEKEAGKRWRLSGGRKRARIPASILAHMKVNLLLLARQLSLSL